MFNKYLLNESFSLFLLCIIIKGLFTNVLLNLGAENKPKGLAFITKISLWRSGVDKPCQSLISNLDKGLLGSVLSHELALLSRANVIKPQFIR